MVSPIGSPWSVIASLDGLFGVAKLAVTHATDISYLASVTITPVSSEIAAGKTQSYTATATDSFGNSWDVTAEVSAANGWSITAGAAGSWADATYTSEKAGSWTVTGHYLTQSNMASLIVTPNSDNVLSLALTPKTQTIVAGNSQPYIAIATDSFGNSWDVSNDPGTVWNINSGSGTFTWTGSSVQVTKAGVWTVTATYAGQADTGALTVTPNTNSIASLAISPKTQTIAAGDSITYTAIVTDSYGNTFDVSTDPSTTWTVDVGASGSWNQATYTSTKAGSWAITATYNHQTDTAILTVTHATDHAYLDYITITPASQLIAAGDAQSYTATAADSFGNTWDVTADVSIANGWTVSTGAGGSWNGAIYTSEKAGSWIVTGTYFGESATAYLIVTHATDIAYLDYIVVSVDPRVVAAPNSVTGTAVAYDTFGNSWDVSNVATWSIPAGNDGGSWVGNVYTSHTAGTFSVQALFEGKTAIASLTVTHASDVAYLDHITIAPKEATVNAGISQTYSTTAYDSFGNSWTINAIYSCPSTNAIISQNTVYSKTAGSYIITGTFNGKTDNAKLTVTGHLSTILTLSITPKTASIFAGSSKAFTAIASDGYNTWDVTNQAVWSIVESGNSGSWTQATGTYTSAKAGTWTVQATLNSLSDTAILTVQANAQLLDHITIAPKTATINAGSTQSFSVEAFDQFGNSLGSVTASAVLTATGATVTGNSVSANSAGSYTVTATYNGKSDTATLTVNAAPTTAVNSYTFIFTEKGLPAGKTWTATLNGQTKSTTSSTITFSVPAGVYYLERTNLCSR